MTDLQDTSKDHEDLIRWNPLVPGVPEVTLQIMHDRQSQPQSGRNIPIKVIRNAEITQPMKQEIMKILMDDSASSGHEVRAALWLEEQLDHACSKSDCHDVVKQVKKTYRSNVERGEKPIVVRLSRMFWVDESTFKLLVRVPGVYRMDKPGSMAQSIEIGEKMPSREAIKAMEKDLNYDDYTKDLPGQSGTLVAVDSQPTPRPSDMAGPMPRRDTKGRRSL